MTRAFQQALRAGVIAYAISLLAIALFVSPIVGTHLDFGHTHAQNTVAHAHAISDFYTSSIPLTQSFVVLSLVILASLSIARSSVCGQFVFSTRQSRAPPVFL